MNLFIGLSSDKLYLGLTQSQIQVLGNLSMPQIRSTIESGDPFGVLYRNFMSGHWVLGIGYATAPGMTHWLYQMIQGVVSKEYRLMMIFKHFQTEEFGQRLQFL